MRNFLRFIFVSLVISLLTWGSGSVFAQTYDNSYIGPMWGAWNDPANWTAGVPTSDQNVIVGDSGFSAVTVGSGVDIEFGSLTVGNGVVGSAVDFSGRLVDGGDLIVNRSVIFIYKSPEPLYLKGDLKINDATFSFYNAVGNVFAKVEAENINIATGSLLQAWSSGYVGFGATNGNGPFGGLNSSGVGVDAQGGSHKNCNLDEDILSTLGSAGGAYYSGGVLVNGGSGGGNLVVKARGDFYIDGVVNVDGESASSSNADSSGGGGGALTVLGTNIMFGTNGILYANGGGYVNATYRAGSGGCIKLNYENSSNVKTSNVSVLGGRVGTSGRGVSGIRRIQKGPMPDLGIEPVVSGGSGSGLDTSATCDYLRGESLPLSSANINEGKLEYSNASYPADQYKACAYRSEELLPSRKYFGGWVWNTNLGWVSMGSFSDGAGNSNRGVSTGSQEYQSYIDLTYDATGDVTGGEMFGYLWGDATGWIRLNCDHSEYSYNGVVAPNILDMYCGASPHRVTIDTVDLDTRTATLTGYAWSDNVKWVNMEGVVVPLDTAFGTYSVEIEKLPVQYLPVSGTQDVGHEGNPYANGLGAYQLLIRIFDTSLPPADQNVTLSLFDNDDFGITLDFDDSRHHTLERDSVGDLPVNINGDKYGLMYFNLDKSNFKKFVGRNAIGLIDSVYYPKSYVPAEAGDLSVTGVNLIFSAGSGTYTVPVPVSVDLPFDVPYELNMFQGTQNVTGVTDDEKQELCEELSRTPNLELEIGVNQPLKICGKLHKGGALTTLPLSSIFDLEVTYDFSDFFSDGALSVGFVSDSSSAVEEGSVNLDIASSFANEVLSLIVDIVGLDDVNLEDVLSDSQIKSFVSYQTPVPGFGYTVTRNGPGIIDTDLTVASANISGNVQSGAFQQIKADASTRETGRAGSTRNVKREAMVKAINEYTRNSTGSGCKIDELGESYKGVSLGFASGGCAAKAGSSLYVVQFTGDRGGEIIRMSDLAHFSRNGGDPVIPPNSTLVIEGASIVIDRDIYYTGGGASLDPSKAIGLVVLKDNQGRGGHAYVTSDVTDLRTHIYLDGSMFSVESATQALTANARTGAPAVLYEDRDTLYSQLTISGTLVSQNTVGGALEANPKLGDNSIGTLEEAKKYDLNFWRFSPLGLERAEVTGDWDGNEDTPDETRSVVRVCGGEASTDFNTDGRTSRAINVDLEPGWYPADLFYSNTDRVFRTSQQRAAALCWQDRGEESRYMIDVLEQPNPPTSSAKVVNVVFEGVPSELPVFND